MARGRQKSVFKWVVLMLLGCLSYGCAGGPGTSPAAPPAPPAEVPSFLRIPSAEQLEINTDKISPSTSSSVSLSLQSSEVALELKSVVGSGEFGDEIVASAENLQFVQRALTKFLDPLHQLRIPVREDLHNFSGLAVIMQGEAIGSPGDFVAFKIDFSDFDYDGDGLSENCSGNTAKLPICMRIWADSPLTPFIGEREAAAVFTSFPSDLNAGAGRLKVLNLDHTIGIPFFDGAGVGIVYDHRDPEDRSTELFVNAAPGEDFSPLKVALQKNGKSEVFEEGTVFKVHALATQKGPDETAIKTINTNVSATNFGDVDFFAIESVTQWREGDDPVFDFWIGTLHPINRPDLSTLDNQCAQISTGKGVATSFCDTAGISVLGIPIVAPVGPDDASLPDDFPATPTF